MPFTIQKKMNAIGGAKIWWHWVTYGLEAWEKLWHNKYSQERDKQDLFWFDEEMKGSHIWNSSMKGRGLI